MTFFQKIKSTKIYKVIIQHIFYPFFHFIWKNIINFEAKMLAKEWKKKNKDEYYDLKNKNFFIIKNDLSFSKIANEIEENSANLIEGKKNELIHNKNNEKIGKMQNEADLISPYRTSLYENLSNELKSKIVNFGSSNKILSSVINFLGVFPILTRVQVYMNIPRINSNLRGAMFWHKDTFGFKNLDLFMYVNDVDELNGPVYFLKKNIKASTFLSFSKMRDTNISGERGKIDTKDFDHFFKEDEIEEMKGKKGTALFIDSFSTYHRGGFCKDKHRIVLRYCYQSHDAYYPDQFDTNGNYIFDKNLSNFKTNDKFKKYL